MLAGCGLEGSQSGGPEWTEGGVGQEHRTDRQVLDSRGSHADSLPTDSCLDKLVISLRCKDIIS